jgi:hypothetical protein
LFVGSVVTAVVVEIGVKNPRIRQDHARSSLVQICKLRGRFPARRYLAGNTVENWNFEEPLRGLACD